MKNLIFIIIFWLPQVHSAQIISVGSGHALLKCKNGDAFTCGNNDFGQQGQSPSAGNVFSFAVLNTLDSIKAIAAGGGHAIAIAQNGKTWAWGQNDAGQVGIGNYTNQYQPVVIDTLEHIVAASGGSYHSLFLKSDSTVWGCGDNSLGAVGKPVPPYSFNKPVRIDTLRRIVKISAGRGFSLALDKSGTVWAFGQNYWGQLGVATTQNKSTPTALAGISHVTDIDAGSSVSYAVTGDGKVWGWGRNKYGELGNAVPRDNNPHSTPVEIPGISNAVQVEAGYRYALALLKDGTVMAWGRNKFYELGDSTTTNRYTPVKVKNLQNIHSISANVGVAFAIDSFGQIFSWGYSPLGSLASGMDTLKPVPTPVPFSDCNPLISLAESAAKTLPRTEFYPNPTRGKVYWESGTPIEEAVLFDLTGLPVKHFNRPTVLDITEVPKGMYLLKVKTGDDWVVRKIWKQ